MRRTAVIVSALVCVMLLFAGAASAGVNTWTGTGPDGGPIRSVLVDPTSPGIIYAGTGGSGVFKSIDGGATWVQLDPLGDLATKTVRSLVFGATTATIYAGADNAVNSSNGVFESIDSGANWTPIGTAAKGLSNRKVQSLAWDDDALTLYAGTREENPVTGGVFKRVAGADWVRMNNGLGNGLPATQNTRRVQALAIDPRVPAVYAGTQGAGVFRTLDGGANWAAIGFPNPNQGFSSACLTLPEIESLAVDQTVALTGGTNATLYAGVRGQVGTSGCDPLPPVGQQGQGAGFFRFVFPEWDRRMNGMFPLLPTLTLNVWSVVMNLTQIFIGTDQGVFRSDDGTGSWSLMPGTPPGGFMGLPVRALGVDPTGQVTLYAGTNGRGVFKRLPPNNQPSVQTQLWCGAGSPLPCAASSGLTALRAQSTAVGLRGGAKAVFAGLVGGGVITSVDNGATWQNTPDPEPTARSVFGFAVDPTDQSVVYAATGQGVILTENGGDSWTIASTGLPRDAFVNVVGPGPFRTVRSILVDPANPLVLYAGVKAASVPLVPGGVYGSVDGGANWTALNTGLPAAATTGTTGVTSIVTALVIDRGPGTGAWGTIYAAIAATEGTCTISTCGVFKSIDGGGAWTPMNGGIALPADLSVNALTIDPLPPANLYAGTTTGKAFKFLIGGTNWAAFSTGLPGSAVNALVVKLGAPSKIYAGLDGAGVYTTPAGGSSSWAALSANTGLLSLNVAGLGLDPEGEGTLYAATLGRGIFDYEFIAGGASPQVSIDIPTPPSFPTATSPITISGTAGGIPAGIFKVFWSTSRGHFGVAALTPPNWSTSFPQPEVPLEPGPNFITVTAVANDSSQGSATITVNFSESTSPTVTITTPTTNPTFATTTTPLVLGGTASDNTGVTQVTWVNSLGGSGTATGTTSWTASIPLQQGSNVITVTAHDAAGNTGTDVITVSFGTFTDVPTSHPFFSFIEAIADAGITAGCSASPPQYCPDAGVNRDQMAVFLLRGIHGAAYDPPPATGMFTDVPPSQPFAKWIEQLARENITAGCSISPAMYCPTLGVTRGQMAVFLLRSKHGAAYDPPAATGTMFTDVPSTHPFAKWIEQLAKEGITGGCSPTTYCPDSTVTRGQMAVFLVRTFDLPM